MYKTNEEYSAFEKRMEKIIKSNGAFWNYHNDSYFKFNLYDPNISNQHNILVNLAQDPANLVYYCAPLFIKIRNYLIVFLSKLFVQKL